MRSIAAARAGSARAGASRNEAGRGGVGRAGRAHGRSGIGAAAATRRSQAPAAAMGKKGRQYREREREALQGDLGFPMSPAAWALGLFYSKGEEKERREAKSPPKQAQ